MHLKNLWRTIMKEWRKDNWLYMYSPPFGDYNYHYYTTHPYEYVGCLFRKLKWFYQRGSRGYADCDVWSLDWHLTSYMGKALRDLAEQVHGVPAIDVRLVPPEDPNDMWTLTIEEWRETIIYLAETFDLARKVEDYDVSGVEEMERIMKRFHHGMLMFSEYFFNLWD